jgi:Na+/H+ antiporter NhaA
MEKIISAKLSKIFKEFFANQQISGILLVFGTVVSLILANSQYGVPFQKFWGTKIGIEHPQLHLNHSIADWINDGFMTLFFVGLFFCNPNCSFSVWRNTFYSFTINYLACFILR